MLPRVSVVLPYRDAARWLPSALVSLQQQSGIRFELLAVDDGSSDGSSELIRTLWEGQVSPLRMLEARGRGVSAARNIGWQVARAPLVAFLDADDLCLPGRLAGQAAVLESRPELAHVMSGWQRIDEQGRLQAVVEPWQEGAGFTAEQALRHKAVLPSAWMLRREVLERTGGFDPALSQAEDVDLLLRLALAGEPGAWWQQTGCSYRCHAGGASGRARDQARGLLWVTTRQLNRLGPDPLLDHFRAEVLHATRAWAGWNAWRRGESDLAFELWRTALGLSPLPPALTWAHLAENVARSEARDGQTLAIEKLLDDPLWRRLERHWLQRQAHRRHAAAPLASPPTGMDPAGRLLMLGRSRDGLCLWRQDLCSRLGADPRASSWHPRILAASLPATDPLRALRTEVLQWCEALLAFRPQERGAQEEAADLVQRLAVLLLRWAHLTWGEDRRPTARRLEESAALHATPNSLRDLARLQRTVLPAGAAALEHLAVVIAEGSGAALRPAAEPPPDPAFWERPSHQLDRCEGPACAPCAERWLQGWQRRCLAPGSELWIPPRNGGVPASPPLSVMELRGGSAWIRPPDSGPWGTTHAVAVADRSGEPREELCRRYPIGWPGCPHPSADVEPPPQGEPLQLQGPVLAVADLSAEVYYHWLLENLPRLGMALEALEAELPRSALRIWHNGGDGAVTREALVEILGLDPDQLIDARLHPWIRAEHLLVPGFPSPFGQPGGAVRAWLRSRVAPPPGEQPWGARRLWLSRHGASRRPVWGEAECLRQLERFGLTPVDPSTLGLRRQAALMTGAELVVAPHGAALANLVFAPPGTDVLELHHPDYAPPYFHTLAATGGLRLARCRQGEPPPHAYRYLLYEGPIVEPIELKPERIAAALTALAISHPGGQRKAG
jgi:hypothetical protein